MLGAACREAAWLKQFHHAHRCGSLLDPGIFLAIRGALEPIRAFSTKESPPAPTKPAPPSAQQPEKPTSSPRPSALPKGFSDSARLVGTGRKQAMVTFQEGIVTVNCTFSNTIMSLTDLEGKVKAWASGGSAGFKNSNKSKPLATEKAAEQLAAKALKLGYLNVLVKIKGMGNNKQYAVTALSKSGLRISEIQEVTPIPYNGCRLPRKRRT